jgi:hypothetical protein
MQLAANQNPFEKIAGRRDESGLQQPADRSVGQSSNWSHGFVLALLIKGKAVLLSGAGGTVWQMLVVLSVFAPNRAPARAGSRAGLDTRALSRRLGLKHGG